MYEIVVLCDGYSHMDGDSRMIANCTCTLVKGPKNVIVDTMTAWDSEKIVSGLKKNGLSPDNINYVVSTHGHSDHIGNNNLFTNAKHIVGFSISIKDIYYLHPFDRGVEYIIDEYIKIIPTPGHTLSDVTVLVQSGTQTIAIVGDLFERFDDIVNDSIWLEAGSENPKQQRQNRLRVAELAEWIIPGHGPKFRVTEEIKEKLKQDIELKTGL